MKKLHFTTRIQASRERVWKTLFNDATYRQWTSPFCEGSHFEGNWKTGEPMRFLAPNGSGMTAVIAENRPNEHMSIKHLGEIVEGVEDTTSDKVRAWAPAFENYTLVAVDHATELKVDLDATDEFEQFMLDTMPKALAKLKVLCET